MDIWDTNKLIVFIAFAVPGFVSLKTYAVLEPTTQKDPGQQIVDAVAYSCINYALLLWPIYEIETRKIQACWPTAYILFYVFIILLAPVLLVLIWHGLRSTQALQKLLPHPTQKPWDYLFRQRKAYWIVATFKDGKRVAGRFDSRSFASSSPAPEQLYLEEAWEMNADGGFERRRDASAGLMILGPEVVTIEFFNIEQGETDEHKKTSTDASR